MIKAKKSIYNFLIFIFLGIFLFSGYKVYNYIKQGNEVKNVTEELIQPPEQQKEKEIPHPFNLDFDNLRRQNKDIIAWIYSPDTQMDYPVVKTDNNDYYLRRLLNGKWNIAGTIFMDYRNSRDFSDLNTVIYGHNMTNGSMFGDIHKYSNVDYYNQHPDIYIITPEKSYKMEIVSGFLTQDTDDLVYNNFRQDSEKHSRFISHIIQNSDLDFGADIKENDKLVTFSTCSFTAETDRYILTGVLREYNYTE